MKYPDLTPEEIAQIKPNNKLVGEAITPLYEHLAAFVPLEIREWQKQGGPEDWHFEEMQRRMRKLQENPDSDSSILMAGHRKGLAASSIAILVEGLAVMAFVPGGVKFGPLHFWANREEDEKEMMLQEGKEINE